MCDSLARHKVGILLDAIKLYISSQYYECLSTRKVCALSLPRFHIVPENCTIHNPSTNFKGVVSCLKKNIAFKVAIDHTESNY